MVKTKQTAGENSAKRKLDFNLQPSKIGKDRQKSDPDKRRQSRTGLAINIGRCQKVIGKRWRGKMSPDAPVMLAALLQLCAETILEGAAANATWNGKPKRVTAADIQVSLTKKPWLSRNLATGRVLGVAPAAWTPHPGDDEDNDE